MAFSNVHKAPHHRHSFFYVDWTDKSNFVAIAASVALFVFGFYYIYKALVFV